MAFTIGNIAGWVNNHLGGGSVGSGIADVKGKGTLNKLLSLTPEISSSIKNLGFGLNQQNAAPPMQMQSIPSAPIQGIPADALKALRQRQAQMMGNYQQGAPGYGYQQQPMQSTQQPMGLLRY